MISITDLSKNYGKFVAVDHISFRVKKGEICCFLGVNGAGKTTTLRMLAGILLPSTGSIEIDGISLAQNPREAKRITGYIPDRPYLYPRLTGREYLSFVSDLYDLEDRYAEERIDLLLEEYRLVEWQDTLIESYSHGMKQRLAVCAGLVHEPHALIVDEPIVGLDPHGAKLLKQRFRDYASRGMSLLISTHSLNVAEEISDHIVMIHRGKIIIDGPLTDIRKQREFHDRNLESIFLELTTHEVAGGAE